MNNSFLNSDVYIPPTKPKSSFTADGNLLEKFGLLSHFEQLAKSTQYLNVSETFKPYVSHLAVPVDEVIQEAQKEGAFGSFSRMALNDQLDNVAPDFTRFNEIQLQNSFSLKEGPIIRVSRWFQQNLAQFVLEIFT